MTLLKVQGLAKTYSSQGRRPVKALRGVDLELPAGQILGLVGESGCGKSTLGRCILGLERVDAGRVIFDGVELTHLSRRRRQPYRRQMQMIFQDPFSSLNPRMTVEQIITEPLLIHRLATDRPTRTRRAQELLDQVGLPAGALSRYPHEFSGGQRQRIGIARALAVEPRLIIADEPVSSLDILIQAQVLNLLTSIQRLQGLSLLFISHDLRVILRLSHQVAVMYFGELVELGPAEALAEAPLHPYTRCLFEARPRLERPGEEAELERLGEEAELKRPGEEAELERPGEEAELKRPGEEAELERPGEEAELQGSRDRQKIHGAPPPQLDPPSGCAFHPRCPVYAARRSRRCLESAPRLEGASGGRQVACHESTMTP